MFSFFDTTKTSLSPPPPPPKKKKKINAQLFYKLFERRRNNFVRSSHSAPNRMCNIQFCLHPPPLQITTEKIGYVKEGKDGDKLKHCMKLGGYNTDKYKCSGSTGFKRHGKSSF